MTISGSRQDDDDSPNISPAETAKLKEEETRSRLKKLIREFHLELPRPKASQIGAVYARYSTKFQSSVVDQVRKILEYAVSHKIFVPEEFIFFDLGISGQKNNRPGLEALKAAIEEKKVTAALFFSTSRLYRKTYRSIEFVDRLVKEFQIRCVFVTNAIDTSENDNWQFNLIMFAVFDEAAAKMYVANIRSAHEGMFDAMRVHGTIPFGYQGIPIPDTKNRKGNPQRLYAIDPDEAEWVRQVFVWFVEDLVSINEIIRRLRACEKISRSASIDLGVGIWFVKTLE